MAILDKYAIYLRKSREDLKAEQRGEGETLARHRKILTDFAARQGLYIEETYEEIVSGETIKDRPQIQRLINDCYAGKYKGIVIIEVSRLSRGNQGDAQIIMDCLKFANDNKGLLVLTPTKTYDVAHNPDDEEYMEFELFMSRREYKMILKRMQRGKHQAIVEGNYMGGPRPYGYDIIETPYARTLKRNEAEAPIIEKIFIWKVKNNMTPAAIARKLTNMGVPTYTGISEWNKNTIIAILQNPVYYGKVTWNKRMTVKRMVDGQLITKRPRKLVTDHYMEYEGKHDGIITEELFKAAQSTPHSDKTANNLILQNALAGLLVCKNCGYAMAFKRFNSNRNARILHRSSQLCKVKSAMYDDIMAAVVHGLKMHLEDFELQIDNLPIVDEDEIRCALDALHDEEAKIKKILDKIFNDYETGIYTANEFVERKTKHYDRLAAIKAEEEKLWSSMPVREEYEEKVMYLHTALDMLTDNTIPAKTKNEYLKEFIQKIEYGRENNDEFILDIYLK